MVQGISSSNFGVGLKKGLAKKETAIIQEKEETKQKPAQAQAKSKSQGVIHANEHSALKRALAEEPEVINLSEKSLEILADRAQTTLIPGSDSTPSQNTTSEETAQQGLIKNKSIAQRPTSPALKALMSENGIESTGFLQGDIAAIKTAIASLDKEKAKELRTKFQSLRIPEQQIAKEKEAIQGTNNLAMMNKHFLVNKKAI